MTVYGPKVAKMGKNGRILGLSGTPVMQCQDSPSTRDKFHQLGITRKRDRITLPNIIVFKSANIAVWGLFWHRARTLSKGHARSQNVACEASLSTADKRDQFEITRKQGRITLINIYVFKSANILFFLAFFGPLRIIILGKGHALAQIIACQASRSTANKLDQFQITRKHGCITLINIYVFKGANIAVLGVFGTLWIIIFHKWQARAEIIACSASQGTRDRPDQFEIS